MEALLIVFSIVATVIAVLVSIPRGGTDHGAHEPQSNDAPEFDTRDTARRIGEANERAHQRCEAEKNRIASELAYMRKPALNLGLDSAQLGDGNDVVDAEVTDVAGLLE